MQFSKKHLLIFMVAIAFLLVGAIFFLIQRDWLVVRFAGGFNKKTDAIDTTRKDVVLRKSINFYYWKDDKFQSEPATLIWLSGRAENLKHLISNWLSYLQEERIINKKICLDSAALTKDGSCVYLYFDQSPLGREWSIFKKWRFVESLLKTIRDVDKKTKYVSMLVGGKYLEDDHLDFCQPWPVDGFLD